MLIEQIEALCEIRTMSDRYLDWIREGLKKPGKTQSGLARALGIAHPQITQLMKGDRRLKVDEVPKIAEYLEEPEPPMMVPIRGLAGAGPEGSVLFAHGDDNFGEAAAPPGASLEAAALQVAGSSMRGMADDGWLIFYDTVQAPEPRLFGSPCVCWLADERVLVKYLFPGSGPGLFNLESTNAPTLRDVPVLQVALVTNIVPRLPAQRFMRANPDHPVEDVKIEA